MGEDPFSKSERKFDARNKLKARKFYEKEKELGTESESSDEEEFDNIIFNQNDNRKQYFPIKKQQRRFIRAKSKKYFVSARILPKISPHLYSKQTSKGEESPNYSSDWETDDDDNDEFDNLINNDS